MQIGYARVSTQDQDLRLQYEALRQVRAIKSMKIRPVAPRLHEKA